MENYTLLLGSRRARSSLAGAKGANLSELIRAGFRVPAGYVITTHAFRIFVMANKLESQIADISAWSQNGNMKSHLEASRQIRALFERAQMPDDIRGEIIARYRVLGETHLSSAGGRQEAVPVAVRSSATAEDLPGASFAGQLETLLNVRGEIALIESVVRCFSSLWSAHAISYRSVKRLEKQKLEHAVIVQEMVPADCSGVLFTVNPISGECDEVVINAAWGLGEAVVGGEVTPDNVIVNKVTERLRCAEIGNKPVMAMLDTQGIIQVPVAAELQQKQVLTEPRAIELTRLGKAIETHFGGPQDVEWAIACDRIHVLQSRPVTCAFGVTEKAESEPEQDGAAPSAPGDDDWSVRDECLPQEFDLWSRANVGEPWPNPVSPLVWSMIPDLIGGATRFALRGVKSDALRRARWAGRFYGRVYYNEGALAHVFSKELGLPASYIDRSRGNSRELSRAQDDRVRLGSVLPHLPMLVRLALRQWRVGKNLETFLPHVDQWVREFNAEKLRQITDQQLWDEALIWLERLNTMLNLQYEISGMSMTSFATLERLMIRWFNRDDLARDLITGLGGVVAAEIGSDLCTIARTLENLGLGKLVLTTAPDEALELLRKSKDAAPVMALFDTFLQSYGYRCPNEAEWLYPRWADAPEQVLELIAVYLKSGVLDMAESEAKQRQKREGATAWVEGRSGPLRRFIFRRVLARAQHSTRLRDNGKSYAIKASYPARQITVIIGKRWVELGWLEKPEDVFFLMQPDIDRVITMGNPVMAGLNLNSLVYERRKAFEYWFEHTAPDIIGVDGRAVWKREVETETEALKLEGIAASGGIVRGKVRVVLDPVQALELQPGEILVTRSTDASWSAFFPLISGLVTEIGGQLSHASIVAREYGLPAVVNVRDATQCLKDQQLITVDGSKGLVYL